MSFYTSLSGLDAATSSMSVTSNNIANVGTMGFKESTSNFADVYASSPLQKSSTTIGQGVTLQDVQQEFSQGNMSTESNTLDLAISGTGFFPLQSQDGLQSIYTRNGNFMMNDQNEVVNSLGQKLMVASVDSAGNANLNQMSPLSIPTETTGMAQQTSQINLGLNLPSDASVITATFNPSDPTTYNEKTSMNVYDAQGNSYLATVYYAKTQNASSSDPNNLWQTYVYVDNQQVNAALQQATDSSGSVEYVNKYGQVKSAADFTSAADIAALNSSLTQTTEKFYMDDLTNTQTSIPASVTSGATTGMGTGTGDGINFADYLDMSKSSLLRQQGCSAVTYDLDPTVVGADAVTFGPATARETVTVPGVNGQAPTPQNVADALNNNSDFTASYVAEASNTTATISGINFDGSATNPFSNFSIDVGGQQYTMSLSASDTDLNSLASDINSQLATMDGLSPQQLTVTTDNPADPTQLVINDGAQRDISSVQLTEASSASGLTGEVSTGTTSYPSTGTVLKITALDPSVTSSQLMDSTSGIAISQNGNSMQYDATITTPTVGYMMAQQTPYTRANVQYTINTASTDFTATVGSGASQVDVSATDPSSLVTALNQNSTFNASYIATYNSATSQVEVEMKDPTDPSSADITSAVSIYQNNGDSTVPMTQINTPDVMTATDGVASLLSSDMHSTDDLKNLFSVDVDGSNTTASVGLYSLWQQLNALPATADKVMSGSEIASELTNEISRSYSDEKPFNFSSMSSPTFSVQMTESNGTALSSLPIDLSNSGDMTWEQLVSNAQSQINASSLYNGKVTVSYDTSTQQLEFTPTDGTSSLTLSSSNSSLGMSTPITQGVNDTYVGFQVTPSATATPYTPTTDQRYGMQVTYDSATQTFNFASGTTGDDSSIAITNIRPGSLATQTAYGLGMTGPATDYSVATSPINAVRGLPSTAASLSGNAMSVNVADSFSVDDTNNQFVVTVDGVTGTVTIPPSNDYTIDTFTAALQNGINNLMGPSTNGMTPQMVSGVTVNYDSTTNSLDFTTGTTGQSSYIKVSGDAQWGLSGLSTAYGSTSTWIDPTAATNASGATEYITSTGAQTTSATGFTNVPEWSPVYLKEGELTFDTSGALVSPAQGTKLSTVYLPNGKGALTLNINYANSAQSASAFAVNSQSQDGAPEGGLVGVDIDTNGLVQASYSNGSTQSLGKVVLVNFSNPAGLKQLGNTEWYSSSASGTPRYAEAGSAGYGTVQSGSLETSNVDLTTELVNLISEQQAFQSNSKALQTDTQMTQSIIQISAS